MKKSISILGCGWFGMPLAVFLREKGWHVNGSTTSEEKLIQLEQDGIKPYLINIAEDDGFDTDFFNAKVILVNVPPSKLMRNVNNYKPLIKSIERAKVEKVIFISSTSVYKAKDSEVTEDATELIPDGENALLDIERAFQNASFQTVVIRFGGLVGGARYPGRFFKGDKPVNESQQSINLIHLEDCIQMVDRVLELECYPQVLNGVADTHPTKEAFYSLAAELNGTELPTFIKGVEPSKLISNQKAKTLLGIDFIHADLMDMLRNDLLWSRK
ncbi:NAD(P)H-binding protein [Carboxylicivirga sp. M1479]|uniref:NAD(P)H-binding protein n=1 Tax=Carboxylicivirga sp. M1479 TaxID=2594476 RepID=UPI00117833BD|nr:NAD(P)H-binding protein [Carboxylicivirga sp. M1479]TRX72295.1 hypothetical protein FNN09_02665 [Carboxylicivirga sp. M1479]